VLVNKMMEDVRKRKEADERKILIQQVAYAIADMEANKNRVKSPCG
jgi:hypothetical protein